jgi:hypothetical protein
MTTSPPRKLVKPLNLAYLSIIYNSCTWYEKYFNAKMTDDVLYNKYKEAVKFLTDPSAKVEFRRFLEITKLPDEQIEYLKEKYDHADTYRIFFNSIPFEERCEILYPWLKSFIEYYLKGVYYTDDWEIDVTSPKIKNVNLSGGKRRVKKNRTMKRDKNDIFPSNYRIVMYTDIHSV